MRSVESISHKLDGYAALQRPERDVHRMHAVSQAITPDGKVRADRLDGFIAPHQIPLDAMERSELFTINPGSIAAGAVGTVNVAIDGAEENDVVILGPPSTLEAGLIFSGIVTASSVVTIRLLNGTGGSFSPAAAVWRVGVMR